MSQILTSSDMNRVLLVDQKIILDDIRMVTLIALGVAITNTVILLLVMLGKL